MTTTTNKTIVLKDIAAKTLKVERQFNAPIELVWRAYTEAELLTKWWAPAPWKAESKELNFQPGGRWLYCMVGPAGERHWGCMMYKSIEKHKHFDIQDAFCDENGNINTEFPTATARISFESSANGTIVKWDTIYPTSEALQQVLDMGMEQGLSMCIDQLEALFASGGIN